MLFTVRKPDGSTENRRHVPYTLQNIGDRVHAHDARTGRLIGRFIDKATAERICNSITEPA